MFSEEQYATSLAKFLSDFDYAIVDTCSLMDDAFPKWMDILHGAKDYLNDDLRIIVPRECFEELKKHAKNKEDAGKRIAAKSAIKIIRRAKWSKLLEVGKKEGEIFSKMLHFFFCWIYSSKLKLSRHCLK